MAFSVGSIVGDISLNVRQVERDFDSAKSGISLGTTFIGNFLSDMASRVTAGIVNLVRGAATQIVGFLGDASKEASKFEAAMIGLTNVGEKLALSQVDLQEAVKSLTADGLLTVGEAAQGLKNLLSSGFGLEESVKLMNTFRDTAAFGRQAALGFGEAIVSATEGVKNQNSVLVDNAGVTKNLSVILKEAGFTMQDLSDATNGAAARQALLTGLQKEGEIAAGDAAALAETLAGSQARLAAQTALLKVEVGEGLNPVLQALLDGLLPNIQAMTEWVTAHKPEITGLLAQAALFLLDSLKTLAPFLLTIADRFELMGLNAKLALNTLDRFAIQFGGALERAGIEFVGLFSDTTAAIQLSERNQRDILRNIDADFSQLARRKLELEDRIKQKSEEVAAAIQAATAETTRRLEDQVAAAEAFRAAQQGLPAGIGRGGNVIFNQVNIAGPVTGRDSVAHLLDELDQGGDSNQGGGRGDGETPPPF